MPRPKRYNVRRTLYINERVASEVDLLMSNLDSPLVRDNAMGVLVTTLLRLWLSANGDTAKLWHAWTEYRLKLEENKHEHHTQDVPR